MEEIRSLSEDIGRTMERTLRDLPHSTLRNRHPEWFAINNTPSRPQTACNNLLLPQQQTPPRERYDHTNPRWDNQHPHYRFNTKTNTNEWYLTWAPHEEYKDEQCHFCKLHGHIQWNCPQYSCRHCKKACGHKPENCL